MTMRLSFALIFLFAFATQVIEYHATASGDPAAEFIITGKVTSYFTNEVLQPTQVRADHQICEIRPDKSYRCVLPNRPRADVQIQAEAPDHLPGGETIPLSTIGDLSSIYQNVRLYPGSLEVNLTIRGIVRNTISRIGIAGADLILTKSTGTQTWRASTNSTGRFVINTRVTVFFNGQGNAFTLRAEKSRFSSQTQTFSINPGDIDSTRSVDLTKDFSLQANSCNTDLIELQASPAQRRRSPGQLAEYSVVLTQSPDCPETNFTLQVQWPQEPNPSGGTRDAAGWVKRIVQNLTPNPVGPGATSVAILNLTSPSTAPVNRTFPFSASVTATINNASFTKSVDLRYLTKPQSPPPSPGVVFYVVTSMPSLGTNSSGNCRSQWLPEQPVAGVEVQVVCPPMIAVTDGFGRVEISGEQIDQLGCGNGAVTANLLQSNFEYTGSRLYPYEMEARSLTVNRGSQGTFRGKHPAAVLNFVSLNSQPSSGRNACLSIWPPDMDQDIESFCEQTNPQYLRDIPATTDSSGCALFLVPAPVLKQAQAQGRQQSIAVESCEWAQMSCIPSGGLRSLSLSTPTVFTCTESGLPTAP